MLVLDPVLFFAPYHSLAYSSIAVHLLVVILILAGDDGLPPFLVVQIPLDGLLDAVGKHGLRQSAQFIVNLGGVDGITHIVTLTVGDVSN